jgi:hypothetical protein
LYTSIAHVSRPRTSGAHTHTQYIIRVADERTPGFNWTVYRRYSEFRHFRCQLDDAIQKRNMCDHCAIMSKRTAFMRFPRRHLFRSMMEFVLEERRSGLNKFLDAVTKHARTCKEPTTCATRSLMDCFLMVNDIRYTYLNVNMGGVETPSLTMSEIKQEDPKLVKKDSNNEIKSVNLVPVVRLSNQNDRQDKEDEEADSANEIRSQSEYMLPTQDMPLEVQREVAAVRFSVELEGRVLSGKKTSAPNLLSYQKKASLTTRSSRHSFTNGETAQSFPNAGRFSDPGTLGYDLLGFSPSERRSYGLSSHRSRPRKFHISSAAKRIKKLEEEEVARGIYRGNKEKQKKLIPLAPILE